MGVRTMSRIPSLVVALLVLASGALWTAPVAAAAGHHVMIEDYAYSPASITVRAGDTVTWTNHDEAKHDVVTTSGPTSFRSPLLAKGQSWSFTFSTAGSYSYYCSVHPDMRAKATAQPAPTTTQAAPAPADPGTRAAAGPDRQGTHRRGDDRPLCSFVGEGVRPSHVRPSRVHPSPAAGSAGGAADRHRVARPDAARGRGGHRCGGALPPAAGLPAYRLRELAVDSFW